MKRIIVLMALALAILGGSAFAQDEGTAGSEKKQEKPRMGIGLSVGSYMPTSGEVRGLFGDNLVRIGLAPLPTDAAFDMKPTIGASFYRMRSDDNSALLIPITVSITRGFDVNENTRPYVSLSAGTFYGDVSVPDRDIDKSGFGAQASAAVGVLLSQKWSVEARYDLMSEFGGLDFSAFSIYAAYRVGTVRF